MISKRGVGLMLSFILFFSMGYLSAEEVFIANSLVEKAKSGEIVNAGYYVASNDLPYGILLKIVNPENGRNSNAIVIDSKRGEGQPLLLSPSIASILNIEEGVSTPVEVFWVKDDSFDFTQNQLGQMSYAIQREPAQEVIYPPDSEVIVKRDNSPSPFPPATNDNTARIPVPLPKNNKNREDYIASQEELPEPNLDGLLDPPVENKSIDLLSESIKRLEEALPHETIEIIESIDFPKEESIDFDEAIAEKEVPIEIFIDSELDQEYRDLDFKKGQAVESPVEGIKIVDESPSIRETDIPKVGNLPVEESRFLYSDEKIEIKEEQASVANEPQIINPEIWHIEDDEYMTLDEIPLVIADLDEPLLPEEVYSEEELVIEELPEIEESPKKIEAIEVQEIFEESDLSQVYDIPELKEDLISEDVDSEEIVAEEIITENLIPEGVVTQITPGLYMQLGAYKNLDNAVKLKNRLTTEFSDLIQIYEREKDVYRVVLGPLYLDERGYVTRYTRHMGINGFYFTEK